MMDGYWNSTDMKWTNLDLLQLTGLTNWVQQIAKVQLTKTRELVCNMSPVSENKIVYTAYWWNTSKSF